MPLPLIGISTYHREGDLPAFSLPTGYVDSIRAAAATPVLLPPGEPQPEQLLDRIDGLILAGGGDIDPIHYTGAHHESLYMISEERDSFELALVKAALARDDVPVLCICRGLQVLNVALGGSLHAHIPERFGERVAHRLPPRVPTRHAISIVAGSALAGILGEEVVEGCSWHHQSIDRVGVDLVATAWAEDGVIEAVEHRRHPWCIGVQWHPEMQPQEAVHRRLFEAFVAVAGRADGGHPTTRTASG